MGTLPWTLADFPEGYVLLLHKSPRRTEPSKARRDFYLYGAWCLLLSRFPSFVYFFRPLVAHALGLCGRCVQAQRTSQASPRLSNLSNTPSG